VGQDREGHEKGTKEKMKPQHRVRAVHCDHRASDEEVYAALKRVTAPLDRAWEKLKKARRIGIKFNFAWPPEQLVYHEGQLLQLTSETVARATLRLLREETQADLACIEISVFKKDRDPEPGPTMIFAPLLREYDVALVDGNLPPHKVYPVSGGGQMFRQYLLPERAAGVDAFVSVQRLKNHAFMGVTLCLKNLFGLVPQEPHGRSRRYFHHLVRMPYVLADLGRLFHPTLNIVDGLVAQAGREWRGGEPRITDTLIAGDHVIATDACATHLMGHDPRDDWLTPPFHRDRNALLVAAEGGFGTVNLDEIDFHSEVEAPLGAFYCRSTDPRSAVVSWRRTTAEQALYYRAHREQFVERYAGEYILLQDGEVCWHSASSDLGRSRRELARGHRDRALWLKYVDPEEAEGEHYEVYKRALERIEALGA
jgi:hypothetical protein